MSQVCAIGLDIAKNKFQAHGENERGANLASVAAQLGRGSVAPTGAVYAHATPNGQSLAAGVMPPLDNDKGIMHISPAKKAE